VNAGLADYTPIFLSQVPDLFRRGIVPVDVALIQTSLPDRHGYVSLGISVDIVAEAVEKARLVIAQVNTNMPRVQGDGFLHIEKIDYLIPYDEPVLEFNTVVDDEVATRIGDYESRLVQDGDTIQVGYGSRQYDITQPERKAADVHTS
jgi:acyl-CoA hydrolase